MTNIFFIFNIYVNLKDLKIIINLTCEFKIFDSHICNLLTKKTKKKTCSLQV